MSSASAGVGISEADFERLIDRSVELTEDTDIDALPGDLAIDIDPDSADAITSYAEVYEAWDSGNFENLAGYLTSFSDSPSIGSGEAYIADVMGVYSTGEALTFEDVRVAEKAAEGLSEASNSLHEITGQPIGVGELSESVNSIAQAYGYWGSVGVSTTGEMWSALINGVVQGAENYPERFDNAVAAVEASLDVNTEQAAAVVSYVIDNASGMAFAIQGANAGLSTTDGVLDAFIANHQDTLIETEDRSEDGETGIAIIDPIFGADFSPSAFSGDPLLADVTGEPVSITLDNGLSLEVERLFTSNTEAQTLLAEGERIARAFSIDVDGDAYVAAWIKSDDGESRWGYMPA